MAESLTECFAGVRTVHYIGKKSIYTTFSRYVILELIHRKVVFISRASVREQIAECLGVLIGS